MPRAAVGWCSALSAIAIGLSGAGGARAAEPVQTTGTSLITAVAMALEHGEGVPQDQVRAAALYCEAARLGDSEAQYNLGWMYANGRGVRHDESIAAWLFALAASAGNDDAKRISRFVDTPGGEP